MLTRFLYLSRTMQCFMLRTMAKTRRSDDSPTRDFKFFHTASLTICIITVLFGAISFQHPLLIIQPRQLIPAHWHDHLRPGSKFEKSGFLIFRSILGGFDCKRTIRVRKGIPIPVTLFSETSLCAYRGDDKAKFPTLVVFNPPPNVSRLFQDGNFMEILFINVDSLLDSTGSVND